MAHLNPWTEKYLSSLLEDRFGFEQVVDFQDTNVESTFEGEDFLKGDREDI